VLGQAERAIDLAPDNVRDVLRQGGPSKIPAATAKVSPPPRPASRSIRISRFSWRSALSLTSHSVDPSRPRPASSARCGQSTRPFATSVAAARRRAKQAPPVLALIKCLDDGRSQRSRDADDLARSNSRIALLASPG
jgi:hypothetical protein